MEASLDGVSRGDKELCSETLRVSGAPTGAARWGRGALAQSLSKRWKSVERVCLMETRIGTRTFWGGCQLSPIIPTCLFSRRRSRASCFTLTSKKIHEAGISRCLRRGTTENGQPSSCRLAGYPGSWSYFTTMLVERTRAGEQLVCRSANFWSMQLPSLRFPRHFWC